MSIRITNNATARLSAAIGATDTFIYLTPGAGDKFPLLTSTGDWFPVTIVNSAGELEIVKCTARNDDRLTVVRAQEETTARAFAAGNIIELRLTAGALSVMRDELNAKIDEAASDIMDEVQAATDADLGTFRTEMLASMGALLPPGAGPIPWSLTTAPTGWILADGRTLLATTAYTALRQAYISDGFPHGQDGSGNPRIPDMRGRVAAGVDNMGGTAANRLTGASGGVAGTLGATGGAQQHTLTVAQMPSHDHNGSTGDAGAHSHSINGGSTLNGNNYPSVLASSSGNGFVTLGVGSHSHGIGAQGGSGAHNNIQPTIVLNYILKT